MSTIKYLAQQESKGQTQIPACRILPSRYSPSTEQTALTAFRKSLRVAAYVILRKKYRVFGGGSIVLQQQHHYYYYCENTGEVSGPKCQNDENLTLGGKKHVRFRRLVRPLRVVTDIPRVSETMIREKERIWKRNKNTAFCFSPPHCSWELLRHAVPM